MVLKWILGEVRIRSAPPSVFCSKHSPFKSDRYKCPRSFSVALTPLFKHIQPHRHTDTHAHTQTHVHSHTPPRTSTFSYHETHAHIIASLGVWVRERGTEGPEMIIRTFLLCVCFILCLLSTLIDKREK